MLAPATSLGRWSLLGLATFAVFIATFAALVASGQRGGEKFFDNLWLTVPFLIAYAGAVAAFALGTAGIIMGGERSPVVVASVVIGFLVTTFGVLEVLFPH